jgi:histone deacetylase 11
MIPLVYSSTYNITAYGLEYLHPFDSVKYRRIQNWLVAQGIRKEQDFVLPRSCSFEELAQLHSPDYLQSLRSRSVLKDILEVWVISLLPSGFVDGRVLEPMRQATGGTVLAGRLARQHGFAINIGGGYHHADRTKGGGFCIYADVPVALALLHQEKPFRSVLIVDTDVHQGNGTAEAIRPWPWAHMLDFYEDAIFPFPKAKEECPVPLASGMRGDEYLRTLDRRLPEALDYFAPELVIYNAGSDVLATDPSASLNLHVEEMIQRDLYVATQVRQRGIPLAMVLSGGYGPQSWEAHARSIEALVTRFDAPEISLAVSRTGHRATAAYP